MVKTEAAGLAALVAPENPEEFLQRTWGQHFRHIPGTAGKFAGLLPWDVLNDILEHHRLEPPRLRLTREGKPVPPQSWVSHAPNRRSSGTAIPRLDAAALTRELREGATLVVDAVDELYSPVTRLAQSLERIFHVRVQVNAYAGWRTSHGFDLHWDDHDVLVLQVAGRKQWKVYGATRRFPLARDIERNVEPPAEVLWEGLLQDGDLLYIPRGWWHVATPLDEPTLHLTVGVNNPTGVDFLSWYVDRLRASEVVRSDIPHPGGPQAIDAFAERLREAVLHDWSPDLIREYIADLDAKSRPRPQFALPWTATAEVLPPGSFRVRWTSSRTTPVCMNGEVTIAASGRRWRFAAAAAPVLEMLVSGEPCSIAELEAGSAVDTQTTREFVRELVENGLVILC
jgi:ribosomal protein L16 Arg81 hydroxylase